jgi:pilus assembly protein CpaE
MTRIVSVGAPPTFRQQVARVLEVGPDLVEWVPSVTACEELLVAGDGAPDVLVLSPAVKDQDALGLAETAGRSSPATAVVVVRDRPPDGLLPPAMRAGVRDVVDLSRGAQELRDALERAMAWASNIRGAGSDPRQGQPERRGRMHAVFSSKGGTGKSFLSANLAVALAQQSGQPVALADLDLQMGDAFSYFGREPAHTLADLLALNDHPDPQEVISAGTELVSKVWGYGSPQDPAAQGLPGGQAVGQILRTLRSAFPYTVVDTPAGYTDQVLSVLEMSDDILIMAALDVVSVRHMAMAVHTLLSLGVPQDRFRVVLNRADSKVGLSLQDVERVTKVHVQAQIPSSRLVPTALNRGEPVMIMGPKSGVAKSIGQLAGRLLAVPAAAEATSTVGRSFWRG